MVDFRDASRSRLNTPLGSRTIYRLDALKDLGDLSRLPYTIQVLLEAALRHCDGEAVTAEHLKALASYDAANLPDTEIAFSPGRVLLQDFTGVPAVVDLAAMSSAMKRMGGDPKKVNPLIPCDLVIDHSVQVDAFGSADAEAINRKREFERNAERYEFLKWGQQAFNNFRVVPPGVGIVHQVNLEYLAQVVWDDGETLYPDSLVGTDSHTTMINGLGVLGWGVGGIEAEAVMLGQPIAMLIPEVVGFKLSGSLPEGATATDLVLRVTQLLREHGVVGKFVEFFGPGLNELSLATRATVSNMAPEYGATCGFFPVDEKTLDYLRLTGRDDRHVETVGLYLREQGMWRDDSRPVQYGATLELDMATVKTSLAGPKRPQDRIDLDRMKSQWHKDLPGVLASTDKPGSTEKLTDGAVVIAAITSCTNTSNPGVMLAAGLMARNAVKRGLTSKPWVKTSLAPGSKVVTDYLAKAGLLDDLAALGFYLVGYGCTTCIGNSGPLPDEVAAAIKEKDLVVTSVLSGNRNFEGRIHALVRANYLASPPLVVAYALVGTVDIDLTKDPLGKDAEGADVFLKDIWPSQAEIDSAVSEHVTAEQFDRRYANIFDGGSTEWKEIAPDEGELYHWDENSTYIQEPTFFIGMAAEPAPIQSIRGARCLLKLGDSVTTDHISPAGSIAADTPAGRYLQERGVAVVDFNSYGSRRGNHHVMTRGTFANIRVRNQLAPGTEGGWTMDFTDGEVRSVYDAAQNYAKAGIPLVVYAGSDYGMGSSRDWAAKGPLLLGVKAVIATSYERIHRSNLIGMGVLPLSFKAGETHESLGLKGDESVDIDVPDDLKPKQVIAVKATRPDGSVLEFETVCRIHTPVEVDYYRNGGILHTVLRRMAKGG